MSFPDACPPCTSIREWTPSSQARRSVTQRRNRNQQSLRAYCVPIASEALFLFFFFLQSTFINTTGGHTTAVHNRDQIPMVSCANQGMTCLSTELSQGQSSSSLYLGHSKSTSCHYSQRWPLLLDPSGCAAWDSQTTCMSPKRVLPRRACGFKAINTEYILGMSCEAHAWTQSSLNTLHPQSLQVDTY